MTSQSLSHSLRQPRTSETAFIETTGRLRAAESVSDEAGRIVDQMWQLGEELRDADPQALREVFCQLVTKITCRWDKRQNGLRARYDFQGGVVQLRDIEGLEVYGVSPSTVKLTS